MTAHPKTPGCPNLLPSRSSNTAPGSDPPRPTPTVPGGSHRRAPRRIGWVWPCPGRGSVRPQARVVTFRSRVLRDWSNVGNPGSVQGGFGVGRAVAGDPLGFRRGAGPAGSVPGFPAGRAFRVFGGGLRSGFLPGARHRGQDVAALGFLPVQGVPTRAGAADPLPRARGASGGGGLG